MKDLLWLAPCVAILALVLTWCLRYYALTRSLIDIPNTRSSHSVPTPRGGRGHRCWIPACFAVVVGR